MSVIDRRPSMRDEPAMEEARFLKFLRARSEDERWELIDGEPMMMMHPPSLRHQIIGQNLERLLNDALERQGTKRFAIREIGLAVETRPDFRPQADVGVIDDHLGDNPYFAERFYLAAEVLSDANTAEYIATKRLRYAEHAECLYVLILSQTECMVEVWARLDEWRGRVYRALDDRIELPEFGFSCELGALYARTQLA
ncbi:Uma2 family endonuclease [Jiella sp. MQZ9-1]|uniref:Uma2 family endonuclease n=1 Tax=Jiella flava TaxID=2816857 RepID=A0A939G1N9_9HYPH|nr:Uma2 family endonuclease [Jiella flava]MBO0663928.1 Uma2 family endonuclease [Jiella flava]MCD2472500.1 Uma2 family endonuclease [Jiella flava]